MRLAKFAIGLAVVLPAISSCVFGSGSGPLAVERASGLPEVWEAGRHLYIKGDVGVGRGALQKLESWLAKEAPNWTVVILEDSSGETFRAADGRSYSGMEAVEYALGQGLPNKTAFGELRDERTGEKNGASFALFLRERKFSYSGGEVFDRRGLGEDRWVGELDRPAFRAMSNGGRVVDAVTGTVKEIEGRLTRQIALDQRRRKRAALDAERQRAEAAAEVEQAGRDLAALQKRVDAFRAAHDTAIGDLANPQMARWEAQVASAGQLLGAGREVEAAELAARVSDFSRVHSAALQRYPEAVRRFDDLNAAISELNPQAGGWGSLQLDEARTALAAAQAAHARGESAYGGSFRAAEAAFASAREEIARARSESQRRAVEIAGRDAESARRAKSTRKAVAVGCAVAIAALLGLMVLLARRRRPIKEEVEARLANWRLKFREHTDRLFGLLDRANVVVGSEEELDRRGYAGETERISREAIRDVDRLFIMSTAVERVLASAGGLVYPKYAYQRAHNRFGISRYRRASALLEVDPITFRPGDGVAPLVREGEGEDGRPLGRPEEQEAFSLTFEQLVEQFAALAAGAKDKLDTIESAWASIDSEQGEVESAIVDAGNALIEVAAQASKDGLLALLPLGERLLPSAQSDLDEALAMGISDPVGALRGPLPLGRRKSGEAAQLCEMVLSHRAQSFPAMARDAAALRGFGRATEWVGRVVEECSLRADGLAEAAVAASVSEEIVVLDRRLGKVTGDLELARKLDSRAREQVGKGIVAAGDALSAARNELSRGLGIAPGELLREEGLCPDTRLAGAGEQQAAALAALDRGGVVAAEAALGEAELLTADALSLLAVTRRSFEEHGDVRARCAEENGELAGELPGLEQLLAELRQRFAPSALLDGAGTASVERGRDLGDLLRQADDALGQARTRADSADGCRGRGALIEAASLLLFSGELQYGARQLFEEIRDHDERLCLAVEANENLLGQLTREREGLVVICADMRTRRISIDAFGAVERELESAADDFRATQPDPFSVRRRFDQVAEGFSKVTSMAANDRELFAEATRSLAEASSHLEVAKRLSHSAASDEIPDSRATLEMQEKVGELLLAERAVERRLRKAHEDWSDVDSEADRISVVAGRTAAELRGELERAQSAVASISAAAGDVRDATGWSGDYGVRVAGAPGSVELHRARDFLLSGRYLETLRLAEDARRQARHAISQARAEVARKRRAAEEAAATARRRREARRSSSSSMFSSSSSSSGFGSSSGSSSGFGGSSRSSFSSSSGMSRSGW